MIEYSPATALGRRPFTLRRADRTVFEMRPMVKVGTEHEFPVISGAYRRRCDVSAFTFTASIPARP